MKYLRNEERVRRAKELLLNPYHRDIRIKNVLEAAANSVPRRRFRAPIEELNELVWMGRESPDELKKVLQEVEVEWRAVAKTGAQQAQELRTANVNRVRRWRLRFELIKRIEMLRQNKVLTNKQATDFVNARQSQWESERFDWLVSNGESTARNGSGTKDYYRHIERQLLQEFEALLIERGKDVSAVKYFATLVDSDTGSL